MGRVVTESGLRPGHSITPMRVPSIGRALSAGQMTPPMEISGASGGGKGTAAVDEAIGSGAGCKRQHNPIHLPVGRCPRRPRHIPYMPAFVVGAGTI